MFVLSFFSVSPVSAADLENDLPSPEELLAKVKKNTDGIKKFTAGISEISDETGDVVFEGKLFFKKPKMRIDFTGPEEFEGAGLSAIRTEDGVVTIDEEGYELTSTGPAGAGGFLNYLLTDNVDFGMASVTVAPAEEYNSGGEIRYYKMSVRMKEPSEDELKPVEMQNQFMAKLAKSGQLSGEAYSEWKNYSKKRGRAVQGNAGCILCGNDADIIIDSKKGVIKDFFILFDGDITETVNYEYIYSGGAHIPSKMTYDDGETKFVIKMYSINTAVPIPDKIFSYKKPQ
ncbi:MAG: hypothetical protein COT16_02920 [Elusimicrobia bacterium CG08_land_8_20_14_0_20_44_26]|nr:MAG: hypothetical protein COT16_02920 [Elusimicrobia bacterium CG08_land_8_20_14_0_20_44_26]